VILSGVGWLPATWALVMAGALVVVALGLRRLSARDAAAAVTGQAALMLVLYAAWQYAGSIAVTGVQGATRAGLLVARLEEHLGWPSEAVLQRPVLGVEWLSRTADVYYASTHVPVFIATLVWVLLFHRGDWPFVRTTIVLTTAACLLVQYKPVAPPRLVPGLGVVDTALRDGLSVYGPGGGANQMSAMPSIHVAWAAAMALYIVVVARSRWRWLAVAYPLVTTWVVVVTGNHYLLDGVVAVAFLGVAVGVALAIESQRPMALRSRHEAPGRPITLEAPAGISP
jgi:hypothetical protein